jgi:hypothetical protein
MGAILTLLFPDSEIEKGFSDKRCKLVNILSRLPMQIFINDIYHSAMNSLKIVLFALN